MIFNFHWVLSPIIVAYFLFFAGLSSLASEDTIQADPRSLDSIDTKKTLNNTRNFSKISTSFPTKPIEWNNRFGFGKAGESSFTFRTHVGIVVIPEQSIYFLSSDNGTVCIYNFISSKKIALSLCNGQTLDVKGGHVLLVSNSRDKKFPFSSVKYRLMQKRTITNHIRVTEAEFDVKYLGQLFRKELDSENQHGLYVQMLNEASVRNF